jgi:hypothetical protein
MKLATVTFSFLLIALVSAENSFARDNDGAAFAPGGGLVGAADQAPTADVRNYGAKGDGVTDDSKAVQAAIDDAVANGVTTVLFPSGVFLVDSVCLAPGLTLRGVDAILKKVANAGKWSRMFSTGCNAKGNINYRYSGSTDSPWLEITGFTFDGNRTDQGSYRHYQLEQQHILFLTADVDKPGRLRAYVHDNIFHDGVADAIEVYTNVEARIVHNQARDFFRGGLVVTGGNTKLVVKDFVTESTDLLTGVHFEVDGEGYGKSLAVDATLENLHLASQFVLGVGRNSNIHVSDLHLRAPPFNIAGSGDSNILIEDSEIAVGPKSSYINRVVEPGKLVFENTTLTLSPQELTVPPQDKQLDNSQFIALHIFWNVLRRDAPPQKVVCRHCVFAVSPVLAGRGNLMTLAVYGEATKLASENAVVLERVFIPNSYKAAASLLFGGSISIVDSEVDTPVVVRAFGRAPYNYSVRLLTNSYGPNVVNHLVANEGDIKNMSLDQ